MAADSSLQLLERAREMCRLACFQDAARDFEELARSALPAAPDLWIEATFGLGECFRLRRDYRRAAAEYFEVLVRYCQTPNLANGSRLVESNRYSAAQSFLSLANICRLSLRVRVDDLREFLQCGADWARTDLESAELMAAFRLAELLLDRNTVGPIVAAEGLRELLKRVERLGEGPADSIVVSVRLYETLVDSGQCGYHPIEASADHWAYRWSKLLCDALRAREELMAGRGQRARWILDEIVQSDPATVAFPEIHLLAFGLAAEAAERPALENSLDSYRLAIRAYQPLLDVSDLCEPFWHLVNLIRLQIDPAVREFDKSWFPSRDRGLCCDLAELSGYLQIGWLRESLTSRGMSTSDLAEASVWLEARGQGSTWRADGMHLMERFRRVVRP